MTDAQDVFTAVATTREAAHQAIVVAYAHAKALLDNGERVRITAAPDHDSLSIRQRKFLHGPVFGQIAEQVRVGERGDRYVMEVWKEFFRKLFLPDRWVMQRALRWDADAGKVVQAKRATPQRVRQSTEDLSVKQYSEYIDRVIAHAATEFGVSFVFDIDEREGVRYVRPARKVRQQQPEAEAA